MTGRGVGEGEDRRFAGGVALVALAAVVGGLGWRAGGAAGSGLAVAALGVAALGLIGFLWAAVVVPLAALAEGALLAAEEAEDRLRRAERHDPGTGLPNARAMREHLDMALAAAVRRGRSVAVARFRLSGLRAIGERLGPEAAEAALRRAAGLLRMEARKGDLVARIGPAEFALVSSEVAGAEEGRAMAARLARAVGAPFDLAGAPAGTGCAAGLALSGPGEADPDRLAAEAGLAARAAREGGEECRLFAPGLRTRADEAARLRRDLAAALDEGRIEPWFQPQVGAADGQVAGVEALARWRHPQRGILAPAEFLPGAEAFGLAGWIDDAILDGALDALVLWRSGGLAAPRVGVNLSAASLGDGFLAERIRWALERRDLDPSALSVEAPTKALLDPRPETLAAIEALSRLGVGIDVDDFGAGRASIAALRRARVDRIKVDRSLTAGLDADERRGRCARAAIEMAKGLGLRALAKDVETPAERVMLAALGCDEVQGFAIAPPMPADDLAAWLRARSGERLRA